MSADLSFEYQHAANDAYLFPEGGCQAHFRSIYGHRHRSALAIFGNLLASFGQYLCINEVCIQKYQVSRTAMNELRNRLPPACVQWTGKLAMPCPCSLLCMYMYMVALDSLWPYRRTSTASCANQIERPPYSSAPHRNSYCCGMSLGGITRSQLCVLISPNLC